jgi:anti-sigma factor RsiW
MTPQGDSEKLSALLDSELGTGERRVLESRLGLEPALWCELYALQCVRTGIRTMAQRYTAPSGLRARIVRAMVRSARPRRSARRPFNWMRLLSFPSSMSSAALAGAAACIFASVMLIELAPVSQAPGDMRLMQAAVSSHTRATSRAQLVEVGSSEPGVVQPWLRDHLSPRPPKNLTSNEGAVLVGVRTDKLDDISVAALVYRVRDHVVHAFVWPTDGPNTDIASANVEGFSVSRWSRAGLRYCVVSDLPEAQVLAFAQSLAQANQVP